MFFKNSELLWHQMFFFFHFINLVFPLQKTQLWSAGEKVTLQCFHNKFCMIQHIQHTETNTTQQYLQLESFREIPPQPRAWALGDSPQQKFRLQQLQTPENYNFYFCRVLWASASFNWWKFTQMCFGSCSNAFYTFTTEGRINFTATDFGNSVHGHVLSSSQGRTLYVTQTKQKATIFCLFNQFPLSPHQEIALEWMYLYVLVCTHCLEV